MFSFYARALLSGILIAGSALTLADDTDPPQQSSLSDFYNLSLAELGQIEISIATGNSTPLDKAPATASVIYAAEIEAMGARTLNDVLETVPGLHVSLSSLSRLDSIYSIRGIHTGFNPQVLLLMNGVPVQSSTQGGRPTLFFLPVASIDRVEVIRGPGSAIYGADAYSGVINVITKDAAAINDTEIGGRTGSFGSTDFWINGASEHSNLTLAFTFAFQESDGDDSRRVNSDLQTTLDTIFGTQASRAPGSLSTRHQIIDTHLALTSEKWQINLWNWRSIDAGIGAGAAQALDPEGRDDSNLFMADATYHLNETSEHWDNSLRISYLHYDLQAQFNLFPAGASLPIGNDGNLDVVNPVSIVQFPEGLSGNPGGLVEDSQLDFISIYTGWHSHRWRLAAGTRWQGMNTREKKNYGPGVFDGSTSVVDGTLIDVSDTPFVFLADSSRSVRYVSIQDEWQLAADLMLTTGVRYDDYSDFSGTTNPRMALVWATNEQLTTKLLYGSAFRAPSFAEQRFKNNPVSLGNPDLNPEKIDTIELSFHFRQNADFQTALTIFHYEARDMIEFIPDNNAITTTAQNARDLTGSGFEWEANWKPSPYWKISGNYSWQNAKDNDTKAPVADAPGQQFMVSSNWEFAANWLLTAQLNWVGDRQRAAEDTRKNMADYTISNVTLRRKNLLPNLDISLALRNLSNEDAREPSSGAIIDDYPLESRSGWLEIKYLFK